MFDCLWNSLPAVLTVLGHCHYLNQGRPKAPRRRKMRHGNPRGRGTKIRKLGGKIYLFMSEENKRIKPTKQSNKCVDVYVYNSPLQKHL